MMFLSFNSETKDATSGTGTAYFIMHKVITIRKDRTTFVKHVFPVLRFAQSVYSFGVFKLFKKVFHIKFTENA